MQKILLRKSLITGLGEGRGVFEGQKCTNVKLPNFKTTPIAVVYSRGTYCNQVACFSNSNRYERARVACERAR